MLQDIDGNDDKIDGIEEEVGRKEEEKKGRKKNVSFGRWKLEDKD